MQLGVGPHARREHPTWHPMRDVQHRETRRLFTHDVRSEEMSHSHLGFRSTTITLSPRKNILLMNLSLLTGFDFFLPLPVLGTSVHISFTFSSTMLQCLSKALTLPNSFLLLRQLMRT